MEDFKGVFLCSSCKRKSMGIYTNWIKKITNDEKIYWIFYGMKKIRRVNWDSERKVQKYIQFWKNMSPKRICKMICDECCTGGFCVFINLFIVVIIGIVPYLIFMIFYAIFLIIYLLISSIRDCCFYYKNRNLHQYHYLFMNNNNYNFSVQYFEDTLNINLFEKYEGIREDILIEKGKHLFKCLDCGNKKDSFKDFISNLKTFENKTNTNQTLLEDNYIKVISLDQTINDKIIFERGINFNTIEKKLKEKNPKLKNLGFIFNGMKAFTKEEKEKDLLYYKIHLGDVILFQEY
jgi:hypothetical protein